MMPSVDEYLAKLPADRRDAIGKVRDVINANVPQGYEEKIQFGMISWCVPESALPAKEVYNKQPLCLTSLASQKSHMAVYMLHVYGDKQLRAWFEKAYKRSGKKLDMGQSCVRFKTVDALPLDVIGEAMSKVSVDNYVAMYKRLRGATKQDGARRAAAKRPAAKRSTAVAKQPAPKRSAAAKPRVAAKQSDAKSRGVASRTSSARGAAKRSRS